MEAILGNPAFWLHTAALVLQLVGAALVTREIWATVKNFEALRQGLQSAESTKEEHRRSIAAKSGKSIGGYGVRFPSHSPQSIESIVQQVGPGAAEERGALRSFVQRQFSSSPVQRWSGVVLVVIGAVVGYIANVAGL